MTTKKKRCPHPVESRWAIPACCPAAKRDDRPPTEWCPRCGAFRWSYLLYGEWKREWLEPTPKGEADGH